MSNISGMHGSHHIPDRVWTPQIEVSGETAVTAPPEELRVDPHLPVLSLDPHDPAGGIVIPRGRFVAVGYASQAGAGSNAYRFDRTDSGYTTLTLHDGKNLNPIGMSVNQMFRDSGEYMIDSATVKFRRAFVAEVPFVLSVNEAHGTLYAGDCVTGYWGSTTTATNSAVAFHHRGKPVKWNPYRVYYEDTTASGSVKLTSAVYPGIDPVVISAVTPGGAPVTGTITVAWNNTLGNWVATAPGGQQIKEITYSYGQDACQIGGEVMRIQSITDLLARDDWLKWVEMAPRDWMNWPPAAQRVNASQVTRETPTTIVANSSYRVLNYPMSIHHPVLVEIQGTVTDKEGAQTQYTGADWFALPENVNKSQIGQFVGDYHSINWRTGIITLSGNLVVTAIRVSYHYITDPNAGGVVWGGGVIGLTDGSRLGAGNEGVPSHLNLEDVVAAMRIIVR